MQRLMYSAYAYWRGFNEWYDGLSGWEQDTLAIAIALALILAVAHVDGQKFY